MRPYLAASFELCVSYVGLLLNPAMADMFPQPAAAAARGALQLFDEMASLDGLPPGFMEEFATRFQAGPGPGCVCRHASHPITSKMLKLSHPGTRLCS